MFEKIGIRLYEFVKSKSDAMELAQAAGPVMFFISLGAGFLSLIVILFVAITLAAALNNANLTTIINLLMQGVLNFAGQLGTVGTIAGVMLIVGIVFGGGLFAYNYLSKGKGGGSGM